MRIVDNQTVEVVASFDEPTKSQDGTDLTDLAYHNVYYKFGTNPAVKGPQIPASKSTGGGKVLAAPLLVPAPAGVNTALDFWVTSTDTVGNESPQSIHFNYTIDRVGPEAPTGFTIA